MKDDLVRFGVAMEPSLLEGLDELAAARGCNRSEVLRDLTRAELSRSAAGKAVPAFAAVTLVYDHHIRELSARLTELQHDLGEQVRSSLHVHLDHDHCLEVIVMRGAADRLKEVADRMIGTRGVLQGGAEYVAESTLGVVAASERRGPHADHGHGAHHAHAHPEKPARRQRKASKGAGARPGRRG
jgi:CopG family nickel-responsive transcriptional regulator